MSDLRERRKRETLFTKKGWIEKKEKESRRIRGIDTSFMWSHTDGFVLLGRHEDSSRSQPFKIELARLLRNSTTWAAEQREQVAAESPGEAILFTDVTADDDPTTTGTE